MKTFKDLLNEFGGKKKKKRRYSAWTDRKINIYPNRIPGTQGSKTPIIHPDDWDQKPTFPGKPHQTWGKNTVTGKLTPGRKA